MGMFYLLHIPNEYNTIKHIKLLALIHFILLIIFPQTASWDKVPSSLVRETSSTQM